MTNTRINILRIEEFGEVNMLKPSITVFLGETSLTLKTLHDVVTVDGISDQELLELQFAINNYLLQKKNNKQEAV